MATIISEIFQQFATTTPLEWAGTVTGFLCVYLAAKQNILNWPISIISVLCYAFIFFENKLYGDAVLQIYFLSTAVYGWYYWLKRKKENEKPVVSFNRTQILYTLLAVVLLTLALGLFLQHFTDSDVPFADGFCTSMSFVAQFLMTRKVLQNWVMWIVVDLCYIPLYAHKNLYLTALLYLVFAWIAYRGYQDWRKNYSTFQKT